MNVNPGRILALTSNYHLPENLTSNKLSFSDHKIAKNDGLT